MGALSFVETCKRLPKGLRGCAQNFGNPPGPPPVRFVRNPDPRGCLAPIAHGVLSWTLTTKEDMMTRDDETFRKVMEGIKNNKGLTQAQREAAARKLREGNAQADKQKARDERVKKLRNKKRGHGDDNVIDTGMFGS